MASSITLKWGTLKGWDIQDDAAFQILKEYVDVGASMSAMTQRDTPHQKQILCQLIDAVDGEIRNDWSGEIMTKDAAKQHVMEYQS